MSSPSDPPLRAAIVDDEPAARRGVRLLLQAESDIVICGEASDADGALALLQRERPDLLFLDVQLPGEDGFSVLRRVPENVRPAVVFITAYDEHALRAFEVHAIDYLLKPYEDARFRDAVSRARAEARRRHEAALHERLARLLHFLDSQAGTQPESRPPILVKSSGEIFFLKPEEIDWIEAEGDYMKFHVGAKAHLMRETMARLEQRLDPRRFVRIHRSTIVNLDRVRKLTPSLAGDYIVVLQDGTKLKLSRGYQDRLQAVGFRL